MGWHQKIQAHILHEHIEVFTAPRLSWDWSPWDYLVLTKAKQEKGKMSHEQQQFIAVSFALDKPGILAGVF